MRLRNIFIFLLIESIICMRKAESNNEECKNPSSFNFSVCELPPVLVDYEQSETIKRNFCNQTLNFIKCMNNILNQFCKNKSSSSYGGSFYEKMNKQIILYNSTIEKNCKEYLNEEIQITKNYELLTTTHEMFGTTNSTHSNQTEEVTNRRNETSIDRTRHANSMRMSNNSKLKNIFSLEGGGGGGSDAERNYFLRPSYYQPFTTSSTTSTPPRSITNDKMSRTKTYFTNIATTTPLFTSYLTVTSNNLKATIKNLSIKPNDVLLDDECETHNKCESRSLHITCGYPAANPNSNLNAYCNELKHYIRCAKCKTLNCKLDGSIVSIKKHLNTQETNYIDKCSKYHSITSTRPTTYITSTITNLPITLTSTQFDNLLTQAIITTYIEPTKLDTINQTETNLLTYSKPTEYETVDLNATYAEIPYPNSDTKSNYDFLESSTQQAEPSAELVIQTVWSLNKEKPFSDSTSTEDQTTTDHYKDDESMNSAVSTSTIITTTTSEVYYSKNPKHRSTKIKSTTPRITTVTTDMVFTTTTNATTTVSSTTVTSSSSTTTVPNRSKQIKKLNNNNNSTTTTNEPTRTSKSRVQDHLDQILNYETTLIKSRNNYRNKTTTSQSSYYTAMSSLLKSVKNFPSDTSQSSTTKSKIDHLLVNFDYIDLKSNTLEVLTSDQNLIFYLKILNRTDIFKGIKNGAVYLHSKTGFSLNLNDHTSDLCLTSTLATKMNKLINYTYETDSKLIDTTCQNGWTISFWVKVSNLNLFDKTILKVDNVKSQRMNKYSKFFILKLSNYDLKVQFLFKRKLWTLSQTIIWKSEWTMLTFTWAEFEGITVYVNGKKLLCQQVFEYYSPKDVDLNKYNENLVLNVPINDFAQRSIDPSSSLDASLPGVIYIGLNNKASRVGRKYYWSYRDDGVASSAHQSVLLASSFSESILLDELAIINYKMNSKEITHIYFKDYTIKNEYDSVEEAMFLTSTDNRQLEIVPVQGALIKKYKENWYMNMNGDKQFIIVPNLFDSCIIDAEMLCSFGFTINVWIKFTYNFIQYPIEKNFEQVLFFFGSQDFNNGIEAIFYIYVTKESLTEPIYSYLLTINYKTARFTITKHFRVFINNIVQLNTLNCLTVQFLDTKNLTNNLRINWLNFRTESVDSFASAKLAENSFNARSYASYSLPRLADYGIKASVLTSSNSIGIFGDAYKQSFFNLKHFELRNNDVSLERIEYNFKSANPNIFEFNSFEKLFEMSNVNIIGSPQIVETRFGKSLLFSKPEQKVLIGNVSNVCFGNLNLCKNGYTLRMWLCFTNYNLMKLNSKLSNQEELYSFTKNMTKKIFILTNGGQKTNRNGLAIIYDLNKNQLIVYIKTSKRWYKSEINFKIKLYVWYIMTITWDQLDGLRLYINNRLLDHISGFNYTNEINNIPPIPIQQMNEFALGKADYEFEELNDMTNFNPINKNAVNAYFDHSFENQTEDSDRLRKNLNKNTKNNNNYQFNSYTNNYYEFIIHKLIQYDVRKYPDEIITKNIIVQEKKLAKAQISMNWLWYTISGSFLVIGSLSLIILFIIIKRRASNGFWSRENDMVNSSSNSKKKSSSSSSPSFCCTSSANEEDLIDSTKNNFNLELKQCHLKGDRFQTRAICDEYSTNSLYGTIDRLIIKKHHITCSSTSSQSAIICSNNFNSITKDPRMRKSTSSYIMNNDDDLFDKSEIHF